MLLLLIKYYVIRFADWVFSIFGGGGRVVWKKYSVWGALTSKVDAYVKRSWEVSYKVARSVDFYDSYGTSVTIFSNGLEVSRVLPNYFGPGFWIADRTRFSYDSNRDYRLSSIFILLDGIGQGGSAEGRNLPLFGFGLGDFGVGPSSVIRSVDWRSSLSRYRLTSHAFRDFDFYLANSVDYETLIVLKVIAGLYPTSHFYLTSKSWFPVDLDFRRLYLSSSVDDLEYSDLFLVVGANVRAECPALFLKLRSFERSGGRVFTIGSDFMTGFGDRSLGAAMVELRDILEGKNPFCSLLVRSKRPTFIIGRGVLLRSDYVWIHRALLSFKSQYFNNLELVYLYESSTWVGSLELGLFHRFPLVSRGMRRSFFIDYEDSDISLAEYGRGVYLGSHFGFMEDRCPAYVFPSSSRFERSSMYITMDGRYREGEFASLPVISVCRSSWRSMVMFFDIHCQLRIRFGCDNFENRLSLLSYAGNKYGVGSSELFEFFDPFELEYFGSGQFRFFRTKLSPYSYNYYTYGSLAYSRNMGIASQSMDPILRPQFKLRAKFM